MVMDELALIAGLASTALFVVSYLPMLHRAIRTRDLGSYSRSSLVLANVGNLIQAIYVYSLPAGPIWFLHAFYVGASAVMLGLHLRHSHADQHSRPSASPRPPSRPEHPERPERPARDLTMTQGGTS